MDQISDNADLSDPIARYEYIGGRTLMRMMQNHIHLDLARRDASGSPTGYSWYDTLGRPEKWAHFNTLDVNPSGSANLLIGFGHAYDRAGNKTKQDSLHDPKDNQTYRYDSTGRLVGYDRGDASGQTWPEMASARDYMLDGLGNWDWVDTNVGGNTVTQTRAHTTFNEIASWNDGASSGTLGHDDKGNLLEVKRGLAQEHSGASTVPVPDLHLTWDAFNRMVLADDLELNPSGTAIRYAYDTGNRRVAIVKQVIADATTTNNLFLYGGWQVLEERQTPTLEQSASSTLHRQFVYGNYIDEPLVMDTNKDSDISCTGTSDQRLFYHQNTQFSVYALTDTDGNVVEAYAYDPYGKHVVIRDGDSDGKVEFDASDSRTVMGSSGFNNPYTFTGRRYDSDTGLHYFRNRYYDANLGRFVSRDPLGYVDGANVYSGYFGMHLGVDSYGLDYWIIQLQDGFNHKYIAFQHPDKPDWVITYDFSPNKFPTLTGGMGEVIKSEVMKKDAISTIYSAPPDYTLVSMSHRYEASECETQRGIDYAESQLGPRLYIGVAKNCWTFVDEVEDHIKDGKQVPERLLDIAIGIRGSVSGCVDTVTSCVEEAVDWRNWYKYFVH